jgi:hypothetical protein
VSWNDVYNGFYDVAGNLYVFDDSKAVADGLFALTHREYFQKDRLGIGQLRTYKGNSLNAYDAFNKTMVEELIGRGIGKFAIKMWRNLVPPNAQKWMSVCWSSALSLFCAVAYDGAVGVQVMTSPDGITWTAQTSAFANRWNEVCWSPELNLFCAVGDTGLVTQQIMTSPNGTAWTSRTSPNAQAWHCICWSPELGMFCALAFDGVAANQVMTSPDGINWTARTSSTFRTWTSVCWSPALMLFVAVASDAGAGAASQVGTSPDGIVWTMRAAAAAQTWISVCWSPELSMFVAVAADGSVMSSTNGTAWTTRTAASASVWYCVRWIAELKIFVAIAVAPGAGTSAMMASENGIYWFLIPEFSAGVLGGNAWRGLGWSPELGRLAAVADAGTNRLAVSSSYK